MTNRDNIALGLKHYARLSQLTVINIYYIHTLNIYENMFVIF